MAAILTAKQLEENSDEDFAMYSKTTHCSISFNDHSKDLGRERGVGPIKRKLDLRESYIFRSRR